ncbi:Transcriptional activator [Microbotryomycetes sp. JL221]|nr:Transcriptional activator [Microbotryomycetes sp. JL221]
MDSESMFFTPSFPNPRPPPPLPIDYADHSAISLAHGSITDFFDNNMTNGHLSALGQASTYAAINGGRDLLDEDDEDDREQDEMGSLDDLDEQDEILDDQDGHMQHGLDDRGSSDEPPRRTSGRARKPSSRARQSDYIDPDTVEEEQQQGHDIEQVEGELDELATTGANTPRSSHQRQSRAASTNHDHDVHESYQDDGYYVQDSVTDEQPLYVNAKQYHRILKRRQARARLEEMGRLSRERKAGLDFQ